MQPTVQAYVPPPQYPVPGAPRPRAPLLPKLVLGCALGCAGLALLALIGAGVGGWWMVRPGGQVPTAAVVSPAAAGSFHVADLGSDPGVAALLDAFVRASQRHQAGVPPWMRSLQQMGANAGSPTAGLRLLLPTEAAVSIERGQGGETAVVAAVNPRGMTRVLRLLLARPERVVETYRGEQILRLGENAWAAALDGTFLFANDALALHGGIDRLRGGAAAATSAPTELGAPARQWDLTGSVSGADGGLDHLLWNGETPASASDRARLGVDVVGSDLVVGRIIVDCTSPEAAAAAARALEQRAAERAQALAPRGLDLRAAVRTDGPHATLDWELHGIEAAMDAWIARSQPAQTGG